MKYVDEYRSGETAKGIAARIREEADPKREYRFMEFCGGHTHVLSRWGLGDILPESIRMIHGPGCPVCVMPIGRIDMAMNLALNEHVILCTYADAMRVPASKGRSLFKCRAEGGDVRMIYSPMDAVKIARENPDRQVVFFAIGFETTTPPTAAAILAAKRLGLKNFSVFCCHVLTPAAMEHILLTAPDRPDAPKLNGLVGPAHVSTVIGWNLLSSAASFSMYLRYSTIVVAPISCSSPLARDGFRILDASIAPSAPPAPMIVWTSSRNKMILPAAFTSWIRRFIRSSNSPRYFDPAIMLARSIV